MTRLETIKSRVKIKYEQFQVPPTCVPQFVIFQAPIYLLFPFCLPLPQPFIVPCSCCAKVQPSSPAASATALPCTGDSPLPGELFLPIELIPAQTSALSVRTSLLRDLPRKPHSILLLSFLGPIIVVILLLLCDYLMRVSPRPLDGSREKQEDRDNGSIVHHRITSACRCHWSTVCGIKQMP